MKLKKIINFSIDNNIYCDIISLIKIKEDIQMNKRCGNCARFPFCDIHPEFCDHDKNWIKRPSEVMIQKELKLVNNEDGNFDFEEIK